MVSRLVKKILGLPFKFARRALQLWTPSQPEILPVGGLTPEASSELLFALRQAATTAEVRAVIITGYYDHKRHDEGWTVPDLVYEVGKHIAVSMQDERIVSQWLSALELAQVASDR